jgi:hypothetical protein
LKGFPHLVEMHKKYAAKGLVVLTVSIDPAFHPDRKKTTAQREPDVRAMLQKFGMTMTNLLLDEPEEFVKEKMRIQSSPLAYVFDRQGKWTRFGFHEEDTDVDMLDPFLLKLLGVK